MLAELPGRWGAGALLGWATLPLLVLMAARRSACSVPGVASLALVGLVLGAVVLLAPSSSGQSPGANGTRQIRVNGNGIVTVEYPVLFAPG